MTLPKSFAAVVLLSLALTSSALAAPQKSSRRGLTALASATDFIGCYYTQLTLYASDMKTSDANGTPQLTLSVSQFDLCTTFDFTFSAFTTVPLASNAFSISPSLHFARLVATVPVADIISGQTIDVAVDLAWADSGDGDTLRMGRSTNSPGTLTRDRSVTDVALNAIVTGTVSLPDGSLTQLQGELRSERWATFVLSRPGGRPAPHAPSQPTATQTKRALFATAQFGELNGCVVDGVFLNALTRPTNASANAETTQLITLNLQQYNLCTGITSFSAFAELPLPDDALTVSGNLSSASLFTTVNVTNLVNGTSVPVTLNLLWQATDPSSHVTTRDRFEMGDFTVVTDSKGTAFDASVTGTVSSSFGTFGPTGDVVAEIGSQSSGSITHSH